MKKILATLSIIFYLAFAITGLGGCSGCSPTSETGNGGQTGVDKITTLEGTWKSEEGRGGEHEKIVVEGASIKCYIHQGMNHDYELRWAGIYIPFTEPINEGSWTFENDDTCKDDRSEVSTKTFTYSNEKLSCSMNDSLGFFREISFTKVSD